MLWRCGFSCAALLTALCSGAQAAVPSADEFSFLPHRAVYELQLKEGEDTPGMAGARGLLVYEFQGNACEGYAVSTRIVTEFTYDEGGSRSTDQRTTSFEEADGSSFQFKSKTYLNNKLVDRVEGTAERDGDWDAEHHSTVELTLPDEKEMSLGAHVVFPTEHLQKVISMARKGQVFDEIAVFDGGDDGETFYNTTVVVGPPNEKGLPLVKTSASPDTANDLGASLQSWPVTLSYFVGAPEERSEQQPLFQLSMKLYENGVSGDMTMDYGEFALTAKLTDLETLPHSDCSH